VRKYEEITPISRSEAEAIIRANRAENIPLALIRLAYFDPDWRWVQDLCISLSNHKDEWVRRACATCFIHLARIHGKLEREKVNPVLTRLLGDPEIKGDVESTIEELKIFLK
jgi:hypothetical protein